MVDSLVTRSIEIIRANQAPSGAYIASPAFPPYRYAWFRDGAFVAYAMRLVGESASAERFHSWAAGTIARHAERARASIAKAGRGEPLGPHDGLHTRYTLEGKEGQEEWPNFQLDGLGTWPWSAIDYLKQDESPGARWYDALALIARYLTALWRQPNFDCWEEFGDRVHTSTLAALYGGLEAFADWSGDARCAETSGTIRAFVLREQLHQGHLVKFAGTDAVDASLLGAAVPYGLLAGDDARMVATIKTIERDLREIIVHARRLRGGSAPVLAAYLSDLKSFHPVSVGGSANGLRRLTAAIYLNGGSHLALGERDGWLCDPYFPNYARLSPSLARTVRADYDFISRYAEYLFDPAWRDCSTTTVGKTNREVRLDAPHYGPSAEADSIWTIVRERQGELTLGLVNLRGLRDPRWNAVQPGARRIRDLRVSLNLEVPIQAVFFASPDYEQGRAISLRMRSYGKTVQVTLPELNFWGLVIIKCAF